jgi:uncharacterized protein YukE
MTAVNRGSAKGFEVDPEALRQHAAALEGLRDRFAALAEASASVTKTNGAFGLMFSDWMEPVLDGKHDEVHALIPATAAAVESHAVALRECAESYDAADEATASDLEALTGELP